jgi:DNA polymerase III subunit delta'
VSGSGEADGVEGVPEPRTATRLIGHEAAERELLEAWGSGRMHHGWLFTGPRGIGKATLAFRFARFLLANGEPGGGFFAPTNLSVDPDHPAGRRIASGGHADLLTIARAWDEKRGRFRAEIVVDDARKLGEFFTMTAAEGGWRIALIDGAEDMNPSAANAILKVLEEPPKRTVLLLVSHAPGRLLPTIRSRVRRLALRPLPDATVGEILRGAFPEISVAEAAELARLSAGSPGRAMRLAAAGGLDLQRDLDRLLAGLPQLDIPKLHALADQAGRGEKGASAFAVLSDLLGQWLARLVRGEDAALQKLRSGASLEQWLAVWDKVSGLLARAEGANLDRKQVLLTAILAVQRTAGG